MQYERGTEHSLNVLVLYDLMKANSYIMGQ